MRYDHVLRSIKSPDSSPTIPGKWIRKPSTIDRVKHRRWSRADDALLSSERSSHDGIRKNFVQKSSIFLWFPGYFKAANHR